jgi:ATP-binding cassette subfamily C (CFTR/MRP) protein 1
LSTFTPSVLLCDEPTASVDNVADKIVHDTILSSRNVVLCICHRLHYVHRFDFVAVIEDGKCIEFGPPSILASDASSAFARLAAIANHAE